MKLFFKWAFLQNQWLWFHMLAAAIIARGLSYLLKPGDALILISGFAIFFEFVEYFSTDIEKVYGSHTRFFFDAIGDILGALSIAAIVLVRI